MAPRTQDGRLSALEQRLIDHEGRCEERLAEIKRTVAGTETKIDKLQWWIVGLIVSLAGFCLVTLVAVVLRGAGLA